MLVGLVLTLASGVLMLAADLETFAGSVVFWVKMGLALLLFANGYAVTRAETALRRDPNGGGSASGPSRCEFRTVVFAGARWHLAFQHLLTVSI